MGLWILAAHAALAGGPVVGPAPADVPEGPGARVARPEARPKDGHAKDKRGGDARSEPGAAPGKRASRERKPRTEYRVTDIGTLGGRSAAAAAINERGQIVGIASTAGPEQHAFLWEDGEMHDLGTLGGRHSFAWDVNDRGQVVGGAQDAEGRTRAARWDAGGQAVDLGTLPGGEASFALAINELGQTVGFSQAGDGETHAVLWDADRIVDLGTMGGGFSYAVDINARGEVLGMSTTATGHRAFVWRDGATVEVGPPAALWSSGLDLNDQGQVVGSAPLVDQMKMVGYRWSPDGTVDTFGLGGDVVIVTAVNESGVATGYGTLAAATPGSIEATRRTGGLPDLGDVVPVSLGGSAGGADGASGPPVATPAQDEDEGPPVSVHAFVYRDGEVVDLGTLGGLHASAVDINARGEVVGSSARADGVPRAYVWNGAMIELPTPLDASAGATDISDAGRIVGSFSLDGRRRAFVAVPCTPGEPCGGPARPPSTD